MISFESGHCLFTINNWLGRCPWNLLMLLTSYIFLACVSFSSHLLLMKFWKLYGVYKPVSPYWLLVGSWVLLKQSFLLWVRSLRSWMSKIMICSATVKKKANSVWAKNPWECQDSRNSLLSSHVFVLSSIAGLDGCLSPWAEHLLRRQEKPGSIILSTTG